MSRGPWLRRRLTLIAEAGKLFASSLDLDLVLDLVVTKTAQVLGQVTFAPAGGWPVGGGVCGWRCGSCWCVPGLAGMMVRCAGAGRHGGTSLTRSTAGKHFTEATLLTRVRRAIDNGIPAQGDAA